MNSNFSHVAISVENIDRSIDFYTKLFGFIEAEQFDVGDEVSPLIGVVPPIIIRSVFLRKGSFALDLMCFKQPRSSPSIVQSFPYIGIVNIAFRVDSISVIAAAIENFGGLMDSSKRFESANGVFQYCQDPDGTPIELMEIREGILQTMTV